MHPVTPFLLLLSAMVLIPNYPYSVIFFYTGMALFFTCLSGRENRDVEYSLMLPVKKADLVRARMCFAVCLQVVQLVAAVLLGLLSQRLYAENAAGLEANLAFAGWGLVLYGVFNAVFFGIYYRNVEKVGLSFVAGSVAVFLCVVLEIVATYAVPFVRDVLDTKDPEHLPEKLAALGVGAVVYALSFFLTQRSAVRNFEKMDL